MSTSGSWQTATSTNGSQQAVASTSESWPQQAVMNTSAVSVSDHAEHGDSQALKVEPL